MTSPPDGLRSSYRRRGFAPRNNPLVGRAHPTDMKRFILGFVAVLFLAPLVSVAGAQVVIAVGHRQPRHHYRHHYHHYNR
jgi:hypothetical protein